MFFDDYEIQDLHPQYLGYSFFSDELLLVYHPKLYSQHTIKQNSSLPKAIIVDVDGTLAIMKDRGPFEWHKVSNDLPNMPVINLVNHLSDKYTIIVLSGRDGVCQYDTIAWLDKYIKYDSLYMRAPNDNRKDSIVKEEIYNARIKDKYYVEFILDDRDQVVSLWRDKLGLPCFQVAPGNF